MLFKTTDNVFSIRDGLLSLFKDHNLILKPIRQWVVCRFKGWKIINLSEQVKTA